MNFSRVNYNEFPRNSDYTIETISKKIPRLIFATAIAMSSSRLSPSVFNEIMVSLVAIATALDACTPPPPPGLFFSNDTDLNTLALIASDIDCCYDDSADAIDKRRGRDTRGKRRKFEYERTLDTINRHWLGPSPVFNDRQFERFFRIPRMHFELISQELAKVSRKFNPVNCKGFIYPQVRLIAALQFLAYGSTYNRDSWALEMSENAIRVGCENFCASLLSTPLKDKYLRPMSRSDARRVADLHERKFGTPGCMGALDCMHWIWDMCPVAWHGQFKGKEKHPSIVLEAMGNYNLWIWHAQFGHAGTLNDINIWNKSDLKEILVNGMFQGDFEFEMGEEVFNHLWILVDGIYPMLAR